MEVSSFFLQKESEDNTVRSRTGILDAPRPEKKPNFGWPLCDHLALKYVNKYVYVWKGNFKNKVGMVSSISGDFARLSFAGMAAGMGVQTLRREFLIR